jgi:hypothetical protein
MVDAATRQTTAAAYPPAWHYSYADAPCEGCGKKYPAVTYRHRWCCASCVKDVFAGIKTINRPEFTEDYDPELRWRDVSPEAHLARRASGHV